MDDSKAESDDDNNNNAPGPQGPRGPRGHNRPEGLQEPMRPLPHFL